MNIILSIHPKLAKLIYEGKKTVEWRKNTPNKLKPTDNIYLYETSPVKKVTGRIMMYAHVKLNIKDVKTHENGFGMNYYIESGCVPIEDLLAYEGKSKALVGWCIGMAKKFNESLDIDALGLKRPPQSWCYTEVDV